MKMATIRKGEQNMGDLQLLALFEVHLPLHRHCPSTVCTQVITDRESSKESMPESAPACLQTH
jgi:hypothetical protein